MASLSGFVSLPLVLMMHPWSEPYLKAVEDFLALRMPHQSVKEALPDCSSLYSCRNHGGCNGLRVFGAMTNGCN